MISSKAEYRRFSNSTNSVGVMPADDAVCDGIKLINSTIVTMIVDHAPKVQREAREQKAVKPFRSLEPRKKQTMLKTERRNALHERT